MKKSAKITTREIRLLTAVAALVIFAVATTAPSGGMTCCGTIEPDIAVTVTNKHTDNEGLGIFPNVGYAIVDTRSSSEGGAQKVKKALYVDGTATHTMPAGTYFLLAFELDNKLNTTKSVYSTMIISDANITIY